MNNNSVFTSVELPKTAYSISHLQSLFDIYKSIDQEEDTKDKPKKNKKVVEPKSKEIEKKEKELEEMKEKGNRLDKAFNDIINYIQSYYYEVDKGNYYFYDVPTNDFIHKEKKDFKNEVIVKIDSHGYTSNEILRNCKLYRICSRLDRPRIFIENDLAYINECKGFLHKTYLPFKDYSEDIQKKVYQILDMIKEISCDNTEHLFQAYIKYISQLCHGIKTEVVIYKKSEQGTGKSTETDFIINYVLGKDICVISNTEPLLKDFNLILMGKLLVVFEELPTFSQSQWEVVSSKIKTYTTEKLSLFRGLFKQPVQAENIMNFMINTNCDSIKDSNGRRIMIMPISSSRKGDYNYFKNIRDNCFNLQVGEAFFSYMREVDITNFYAQRDFPENDNKLLAISNQLHPVYKFIKTSYVLKNEPMKKIKPSDLYSQYTQYCSINNYRSVNKNDFIKKLEDINIKYKKTCGNNFYTIDMETLKEIATKNRWLCQYDEIDNSDDEEEDDEDDDYEDGDFEEAKDREIDYKKEYLHYRREYVKYKNLYEEAKHYKNLYEKSQRELRFMEDQLCKEHLSD